MSVTEFIDLKTYIWVHVLIYTFKHKYPVALESAQNPYKMSG